MIYFFHVFIFVCWNFAATGMNSVFGDMSSEALGEGGNASAVMGVHSYQGDCISNCVLKKVIHT